MFHILHEDGLLSEHSNMHNDKRCSFSYISLESWTYSVFKEVVNRIVKTVGDEYVYLSVDIDVLDPGKFLICSLYTFSFLIFIKLAFAPATRTIEPSGWTSRELLWTINGLSKAGAKIVGSNVVEFAPVYSNTAEIIYEILQWMMRIQVSRG